MIIRKFQTLLRLIANFIMSKISSLLGARQLKSLAATTDNPFFLIIMPGSLHILQVFMRYAPETVKFVMILNGIDQWEKDWLHSHYPGFREITLKVTLKHGRVMDLLFDHFKKPFGMIDSDCFVFNPNVFEEIQVLPKDALLNAVFYLKNEQLDLEIPQTYLLFFNPPLISLIKKKFHVNSNLIYHKALNKKIKKKFASLGIDSEHLPEPATKLFDTFRVIFLLGLTEGYRVNFVRKFLPSSVPNSEIYHIGASHFNNNAKYLTFYRGSYFWRRSLEKSGDQNLIDYYHKKWGQLTSQELLAMNPLFAGYGSTKTYIGFVDQIIDGKFTLD